MSSITVTRLTGFDRNKKSTLDRPAVVLGTDAGADVRFDPTWDKTVSPQHCTLEFRGGSWWLKDASRDGCFIGGRKVTTEKLAPGAVLELGKGGPKVQLDFAGAAAPAPAAAPAAPAAARPTAAPAASEPPPMPAAAPVAAPALKPAGGNRTLIAVVAAVFFLGSLGALGWYFRDHLPFFRPAPEQALAEKAKEFAEAVGLVVVVGEGGPQGSATAWAIGPGVFATNSHVSAPVAEHLKRGGQAYIAINRRPDLRLKITRAVVHPRYMKPDQNFEGKPPSAIPYDVGLLYVEGQAPKFFRPAPKAELEKLDSGYRIAFLGFPMEGLSGNNVDVRNPVATMQSGIVTAVTDYWLAPSTFEKRFSVQHNLGATGGASGSPIFNSRGQVVALLNAGNIIGTINAAGNVVRAPSAAMVNYGQRVDLLRDIWPDYPKE
jgi:hypothetical protein